MGKDTGFVIVWKAAPANGYLEIVHGELKNASAEPGTVKNEKFTFKAQTSGKLRATVTNARLEPGAFATRVTVHGGAQSFSFFLRDVNSQNPIFVPAFGLAILPAGDNRSYDDVEAQVRERGHVSLQQRIDIEPEETYEIACDHNIEQVSPIWLGLSRDMRFFSVGYDTQFGYWGFVQPRYHSTVQNLPESDGAPVQIGFILGRGSACRVDITRRLEDGVLPILRSVQRDEEVEYHLTAFATLETQPLSLEKLRGSDYRAAYMNMGGNMLTAEERAQTLGEFEASEMREREEETVCCVRVEAINTGTVPRYSYFRGMTLAGAARPTTFEENTGFGVTDIGRVYGIHRLNGTAMPQSEMAILLQPGETITIDFLVPHQPLSRQRAKKLARLDFDRHLEACREFWHAKLASGAQVFVPEPAINERIAAGLLHCDIAAIGKEPDDSVAATIGWYAPIGSESSPIIQFFDSMGWHDLARRSLDFFLDRQRADGFIQNFGGYQLETGPALWSMGEHWRYTRDEKWVRRIKPKLLKSCEFLLSWRERNKREELRGNGYGLLDGKVADPEDFFHSFMLNALSYAGLQRVGEMLQNVDPAESKRLSTEAAAYREDIRTAYFESMARSPLVPLGNGTWVPSFSTWTGYPGPVSLYAEGGNWFTHGTFMGRDSMIGSLYLVIGEVLEPYEQASEFLLRAHQELQTTRNAGFSQPYYARHDFLHLKRGEVGAYLKTYYNQFTALQDREIYTFWEHYFHASQHKTHEEGWFLMQTRWMLYLEEGDTLSLLPGIPRRWLEDGKEIYIENAVSHFGPLSLRVESQVNNNVITASVECPDKRAPKTVQLRLPHPLGRKAIAVDGGTYDAATETVRIEDFKRSASVTLRF